MQNYIDMVAIRLVKEKSLVSANNIDTAKDVVNLIGKHLDCFNKEVFGVICLNSDLQPLNISICSQGDMLNSIVSKSEVLKIALLSNAYNIMAFHTHLTDKITPSEKDIRITKELSLACDVIGIKLIDHVIICPTIQKYYSMYKNGEMNYKKKEGKVSKFVPKREV